MEGCVAPSRKKRNTLSRLDATAMRHVVHDNVSAHAPPKTKTAAKVEASTAEGLGSNNRSVAASENLDSTFGCFDANPRQKRPLAAVRGKLGVEVGTVGDFAEVPRAIHSTTPHPRVARAYVVHKNLLADINPRFRHTRKTQRGSLPPGAGQDCSCWVFGSFVASGDQGITSVPKRKAPAAEQPGAGEFTDALSDQGASVRSNSPQNTVGTTATNAWLPASLGEADTNQTATAH
jgi:hypothetical protein